MTALILSRLQLAPLRKCVDTAAKVVVVALALNFGFFLVVLAAASLSPHPIAANVLRSFERGELVEQDYLRNDWQRGLNQYNDCMVLQLAINPRPSTIEKALAPVAYVSDATYSDVCSTLHRTVVPGGISDQLYSDRYARYWHGYVPLAAVLLRIGDMRVARGILRALICASIITLFLSARAAERPLRTLGISVACTAALFWALPYYGQGLSFAPGDSVVMLGIAALIASRRHLLHFSRLAFFAAGYGAVITFFEMLTGQLPTAACLLFVGSYLLPVPRIGVAHRWKRAAGAVAAFAAGALITVALKQLLAVLLVGREVFGPFLANLTLYSGFSASTHSIAEPLNPFIRLLFATHILTYRSIAGAVALLLATAAAWIYAGYAARQSADHERKSEFLAYLLGAAGIVLWVLLLPEHTAEHAAFMVRILIVPVSLGVAALASALAHRACKPVQAC